MTLEIEAVCADGLGRLSLLQETPPRVELIDPKALKVVASIDLAVEGRSEVARAWSDPEGSRGEGMASDNDLSRSSVSKKLSGRDINSPISVIDKKNRITASRHTRAVFEVSNCAPSEVMPRCWAMEP